MLVGNLIITAYKAWRLSPVVRRQMCGVRVEPSLAFHHKNYSRSNLPVITTTTTEGMW